MSSFNINNAIMGINIVPSGIDEAIRITESGNVGIGVSSPDYKLDVSGSVNIDGEITAVIDGGSIT